ncbi:MAG TPA: TolC family protein [Verrucomicrobiae bacterium]
MKRTGIVSFFFLAIFAAMAQTNAPMDTQSDTNANARLMSLQDCLQEALVHNLDIQISRQTPLADIYDLRGDYGGWDPTLKASGTHSYNSQPPTIALIGTNFEESAYTSKSDAFDSDIGGTLPWGLQYDFTGSISQGQQIETFAGTSESSSGDIGVQLTQPLLKNFWIDNTRLTIRQAKDTLESDQALFRKNVIGDVTAVVTAYYELIFNIENVGVDEEALELSQTQLSQDQQRVEIGSLAPLSVEQDQSQAATDQSTLIADKEKLSAAQNTLKGLLADTNYMSWHAVDIQPTETLQAKLEEFDLQDSWNKGMSGNPLLVIDRMSAEKDGIALKFDRNQLFPELDLIGSYGYNGAGPQYSDSFGGIDQGNAPFYTYGAKLSMPLGNIGARNTAKAAKITLKAALLTLKQEEQTVMVDIDNDIKTIQSDYESVDATKQARVYAEAALDAEQKTYAVGKATTFEVLQYQNSLTTARSQEIRALANYNEALATLAQDEGSTLARYNVDIEVPQ